MRAALFKAILIVKKIPEEPLVSIIIPCFNREKYIGATLDSCITQTYENLEIILIDDGSTDRSTEVINKYLHLDPRLKYISTVNQGQCIARNIGLGVSSGRYIKFLDSDDILLPSAIESQLRLAISCKADVVACTMAGFYDDTLEEVWETHYQDAPSFNYEKSKKVAEFKSILALNRSHSLTFNEILILRDLVIASGGFKPKLKTNEEYNLLVKIEIINPSLRVFFDESHLILKRLGAHSLSSLVRSQKYNPWLLNCSEDLATFSLNIENNDNNDLRISESLKKDIFDDLYFCMIFAYRNGLIYESLIAFNSWRLGNFRIPQITPWHHNFMHTFLGFEISEKILLIVRKILGRVP